MITRLLTGDIMMIANFNLATIMITYKLGERLVLLVIYLKLKFTTSLVIEMSRDVCVSLIELMI